MSPQIRNCGVSSTAVIAAHTNVKGRNVLKLTLNIAFICVVLIWPTLRVQAQSADPQSASPDAASANTAGQRTVMTTEYGSIFAKPNGFPYSDFGAYIGASYYSTNLNPGAIKGHYSRFHHAGPADSNLGFPYTALRQYEAREVAAGRPALFITATYEGKRRPVIDRGSLKLDSQNRPTSSSQNWVYPINVRDQRYITFWITKYARPIVLIPMAPLGNAWVYVDGATLTYATYGVLDNNNRFVAGVTWDEPFPQSGNDFQAAVGTFFNAVKQQAPDIKLMVDLGSLSDPTKFQSVYANVPGVLQEDLYGWRSNPSTWVVNHWYTTTIPWLSWFGAQGRIAVLGAFLPSVYENGPLMASFALYEILKGPNFFFAPRVGGTAIPLTAGWMGWSAKLGDPISGFQSRQQVGKTAGYRFFSRQYTNGYVYLNWTGVTQTVALPVGTAWFDPKNNRVTSLKIPTWMGTFVNR
jgi:hypothetical protein